VITGAPVVGKAREKGIGKRHGDEENWNCYALYSPCDEEDGETVTGGTFPLETPESGDKKRP